MKKRTPPSMGVICASPNERLEKIFLEKRLERSFGEGQMHRLLGEGLIPGTNLVKKHENNERHLAWELKWLKKSSARTRFQEKVLRK